MRNKSLYICSALLKYGYSKFSLEILEYCEPEKCLEREKYYFDLFKEKNKYNIALDPTALFSGRKHSDESRKKKYQML
jgi:group I intron endonuclease